MESVLVIKRSLNSSVVLAEQNGNEVVLLGKGIGYGKKPGEIIKPEDVSQVFMSIDKIFTKELIESIDSIDEIFFVIAQDIVQYAENIIGQKLNATIYFSLIDHLNFAVERFIKGINISNKVFWEIKMYYPVEFSIGEYTLHQINKFLGYSLPDQEAANVAFHIINAQSAEKNNDADGMNFAQLIGKIVNIVQHTVGGGMVNDDIHYSRFITHVKFFVERFFTDNLLVGDDETLFLHLQVKYSQAMEGAYRVEDYLLKTYNKVISKEELTYLAVHIHRLILAKKFSGKD